MHIISQLFEIIIISIINERQKNVKFMHYIF